MRKRNIKVKISIALLFISIFIMSYASYNIWQGKNKVNKNLKAWEEEQKVINQDKLVPQALAIQETIYEENKEKEEVVKEKLTFNEKLMGKLIVEKTNKAIPIISGTSDEDLEQGAGHYTPSPLPGEEGNSIIFGHRDGVFSVLENTELGDLLLVETSLGKFTYEVVDIRITSPREEELIKSYNDSMITLITCYPFRYVGSAPDRFVVTAKLQG